MNEGRGERTTVVWATILLALTFIWRLMPDDEAPSPMLNTLSIVIELGMLIGVVGLVPRILRSLPEGAPRGGWIFLLVVAVVSGVGIFVIRLAGGPRVELPPRTSSTATQAEGLPKQFHEHLVALEKMNQKALAGRWLKIFTTQDPVKVRTLTRQDLQTQRALCGEMKDCVERIQKVFVQATSQGIAHSTLSTEPGATRPDAWAAAHDVYASTYDYLGLIEQHWDEWLANPESNFQPWQREVQRLAGVAGVASRRFRALLAGAVPPSVEGTEAATLPKQLQDILDRVLKLNEQINAARWFTLNENPTTAKTRTRQDLQEVRAIYLKLREDAETALKIMAQAESKGIDLTAFQEEKVVTRPPFWRAALKSHTANAEYHSLIDQHWDEWKAEGEPPDEKTMKPWQREKKRLLAVILAASKELKESATAPSVPVTAAPPSASTAPSATAPFHFLNIIALKGRLAPALTAYKQSFARYKETRWLQTTDASVYRPQKITRADLHDYNEKLRDLLASVDRLLVDLEAAKMTQPAGEKEYWQAQRNVVSLMHQQTMLLEENWEEWHISGIEPKAGGAKAWQKEALRLQGEIDKLKQNQLTSILL